MKCNLLTGYHYGKECQCADCYWVGRGCSACSYDDWRDCFCCGEDEGDINTDCEDHLPVKPVKGKKPLPKWDDDYCERQIEYASEEEKSNGRSLMKRLPPKRKREQVKVDIELLKKNQNNTCWWCGKEFVKGDCQKDHRHPHSKGGEDDMSNIVLSCQKCNSKKHAMTPVEFAGRLF